MRRFDGKTITVGDFPRLGSQLRDIFDALLPGVWLTLAELEQRTRHPQASIIPRLRDLREEKFGGYTVEARLRIPATIEYRLSLPPPQGQGQLFDTADRIGAF